MYPPAGGESTERTYMDLMDGNAVRNFLLNKGIAFKEGEIMANHTTYKTGGRAEFLALPDSDDQVCALLLFCKETRISFRVVGGGSNIIVDDNGLRGLTIKCGDRFSSIRESGEGILFCQAGCSMKDVSEKACALGITGFEFLFDIPGTTGGGIFMNAGNDQGQIKDLLDSVRYVNQSGETKEAKARELNFGYRSSRFQTSGEIILGGYFKLAEQGDREAIREKMEAIKSERWKKFPMEYPNAGSVFKRPSGDYAGRLIEVSGCSGMRIGDAQVSPKHKGFIINVGHATSRDIVCLINAVQTRVKEATGVELQLEQRVMGNRV